ncbi:MAG: ParA family protein [Acidobacteriota bacterium]
MTDNAARANAIHAPRASARVFAIANQKGGVGKTTTAINLGASLGALERRVLVIDCDPQGNATRGLGLDAEPPNHYHVLSDQAAALDAVRPTAFDNLHVLPADRDLVGIEVEVVGEEGWALRMREAIATLRDRYDEILLDCPPSLGHLTVNALTAADAVLVPLQCEYFALEGISELISTVERIRGSLNPALALEGVVLTMYDDRTNLARDVADEVRRHFADRVYRAIVPRNVRLAEAPSHGTPILHYDARSRGATAYLAVAQELLERTR